MKKLIAMAAALAVTSLSAFALDITVGARGNFNMGIGTSPETYVRNTFDDIKSETEPGGLLEGFSWEEGVNFGGGFGVYANFGMLNIGKGSFGIQPEFDMNFNNGYHFKTAKDDGSLKTNCYTTTIDIPILFTFTYPVMESLSIGGGIGQYFSIPLGLNFINDNCGTTSDTFADLDVSTNLNFGVAFDFNGAYKLGPGSIVLDLRYMLDLTPTRITTKLKNTGATINDDVAAYTRRALAIGLGYQVKF
ncbi:MAG: hypothetical protein J5857_11100 [Treponema sp.]|nr:hypothetical protein [Treponema sp.]